MIVKLSRRTMQLFDFIKAYKSSHDGLSPSVGEIRVGLSMSSNSLVHYHTLRLEGAGLIVRDGGHRSKRNIRVVGGRWLPPDEADL